MVGVMANKKIDIWMPIYIGDYLKDTSHLTTEEHGAYFLLILRYWTNGGPLLNDDGRLARVAGLTPDAWLEMRPIIASFFQVDDGCWRHKRIDAELQTAMERRIKYHERAKKAAEARWGGERQSDVSDNTPPINEEHIKEDDPPDPFAEDAEDFDDPFAEDAIASDDPGKRLN